MSKRKKRRRIELSTEEKHLFGDNLKKIMDEKGLRQVDVARMVDTSPQQVSQYVNSLWQPSLGNVFEFAQALGVHPVELLTTDETTSQLSVGRKILASDKLSELFRVSETLSENQLNALMNLISQFS